MQTLPIDVARAELADAAQKAETEALLLLGSDPSARDALSALAICTARQVQGTPVVSLPWSSWLALVEFLACDPAYVPSEVFPVTKWQLSAAWWMPNPADEGSYFATPESEATHDELQRVAIPAEAAAAERATD